MDELAVLWFIATMAIGALVQIARSSSGSGDALSVVSEATFLEAARRKHRVATANHLFAVLLEVPEVAAAWQARGWPLRDARRAVGDRLDAIEASPAGEAFGASPDLEKALHAANVAGGPQTGPARDAVVLAILVRGALAREATMGSAFGAESDRYPFHTFSLEAPAASAGRASPETPYRSAAQPRPSVKVVFWNDERTTMEAVVRVLVDAFGMSETRAVYLMISVHRRGRAVVWSSARLEAEGLAARATAIARAMGMPLRVSVEG